jgi:3-deoxy-D-manno-octulosonate 8-phosphate phosphatase (KDO 8-P phosphatase)
MGIDMATGSVCAAETLSRLSRVRLLALDVDGTLTDGVVAYDDGGGETRRFHIHDGLGIVMARFVGLETVWITGRSSPLVERRARELGIKTLVQGVRDKGAALTEAAFRAQVPLANVGFMGDDLNDLPALHLAVAAFAPADAVPEVRSAAHFVSSLPGGRGAVRDALTAILRARGDYDAAVGAYLLSLSVPIPSPTQ